MTGKHTPGPWDVAGEQTGVTEYSETRHIYAQADKSAGGTGCVACVPSSSANARLISAAPELLDALRRLALAVEDIGAHGPGATRDEIIERMHRDDSGVLRSARMAILKATSAQ